MWIAPTARSRVSRGNPLLTSGTWGRSSPRWSASAHPPWRRRSSARTTVPPAFAVGVLIASTWRSPQAVAAWRLNPAAANRLADKRCCCSRRSSPRCSCRCWPPCVARPPVRRPPAGGWWLGPPCAIRAVLRIGIAARHGVSKNPTLDPVQQRRPAAAMPLFNGGRRPGDGDRDQQPGRPANGRNGSGQRPVPVQRCASVETDAYDDQRDPLAARAQPHILAWCAAPTSAGGAPRAAPGGGTDDATARSTVPGDRGCSRGGTARLPSAGLHAVSLDGGRCSAELRYEASNDLRTDRLRPGDDRCPRPAPATRTAHRATALPATAARKNRPDPGMTASCSGADPATRASWNRGVSESQRKIAMRRHGCVLRLESSNDDPALRGKPVVVAGAARVRWMCAARPAKPGVRRCSAMLAVQRGAPVPGSRFYPGLRCAAVSRQVRGIFERHTNLIEPACWTGVWPTRRHGAEAGPGSA